MDRFSSKMSTNILTNSFVEKHLLASEIEEMNTINEKIGDIILRAAKKIEPLVADPQLISARLTKLWPQHGRMIRHVLPEHMKRPKATSDNLEQEPQTSLQKAIRRLIDAKKEEIEMWNNFYRKLQENPKLEEAMTVAGETESILEAVMELEKDVVEIKALTDDRKKLFAIIGLLLKSRLDNNRFLREVAKKVGITQKWAKLSIKNPDAVKTMHESLEIYCKCGEPLSPQVETSLARIPTDGYDKIEVKQKSIVTLL